MKTNPAPTQSTAPATAGASSLKTSSAPEELRPAIDPLRKARPVRLPGFYLLLQSSLAELKHCQEAIRRHAAQLEVADKADAILLASALRGAHGKEEGLEQQAAKIFLAERTRDLLAAHHETLEENAGRAVMAATHGPLLGLARNYDGTLNERALSARGLSLSMLGQSGFDGKERLKGISLHTENANQAASWRDGRDYCSRVAGLVIAFVDRIAADAPELFGGESEE